MSTPEQSPGDKTRLQFRLRLVLMAAVPLGAVIGFVLAGATCSAIQHDQSHNGAIAVAGVGALGLLVGAVLSPILVWLFFVKRRWKW